MRRDNDDNAWSARGWKLDRSHGSFEGARAGQADMGIQNLGYELVRTDGLTAYWFNRANGACAAITTSQGRYSKVDMLPAEDC